jgi:hypothetical protein
MIFSFKTLNSNLLFSKYIKNREREISLFEILKKGREIKTRQTIEIKSVVKSF